MCKGPSEKKSNIFSAAKKDTTIKYAKRFSISNGKDVTYVYLFGDRNNYDTTSTFIIYSDSNALVNIPPGAQLIKSPCKKIAALSSIYATIFSELGTIESLVAIDNIDYVNNADIIAKYNKRQFKRIGKNASNRS